MRIGILTLPLHTNYGGILQAYALQTVLERMGHEVVVFDTPRRKWHIPIWKKPLVYGKRILKRYLLGDKSCIIFREQKEEDEYPIICQHTRRFIDKYIHLKSIDNLCNLHSNDFDCIVVGSDQIWRPLYYADIENAFLKFAENWDIKRIAYAASFGTDKWEYTPEQTEECGQLVRLFDQVSVRESAGVEMCRKHFGIEAQLVLDPTMLLEADDYISLLKDKSHKDSGLLLSYVLDETDEKKEIISAIANEKGLKVSKIGANENNYKVSLEERVKPSVEQWIRGFYDADFVVTDSFHACVFSILFKKQFIVIGNEERGVSRLKSLLGMFGLENRLIYSKSNDLPQDVEYPKVSHIVELNRNKSMTFIANAILYTHKSFYHYLNS